MLSRFWSFAGRDCASFGSLRRKSVFSDSSQLFYCSRIGFTCSRARTVCFRRSPQTIDLGFAYRTPMSARQIAQPEISNPRPHQPFHFVTDRIKHAPDLLINSLAQNNAHSGRTDRMELCNLGAPTIQENSAQKFLRERAVPLPIERHLVFFFDFEARMGELLRKVAVVR